MIKLNNFYIGESVEFMRDNMSDEFVDLTVTSPPYDSIRKYKGFKFDYKSMIEELYRVTKQGGVVVWVVGDQTHKGSETGTSFKQALYAMNVGFNLHDTMIYEKLNPIPLTHNRYEQYFEYMFVFSKNKPKTFNPIKVNVKNPNKPYKWKSKEKGSSKRDRSEITYSKNSKIKSNIWIYALDGNREPKNHPAPFPEQLAHDHIISWSNPGDIVFDPMCGSGTTCKMAWLNKRKFIGIDMSEEYINDICIPRLEMYGWKQEENKNTNIIF